MRASTVFRGWVFSCVVVGLGCTSDSQRGQTDGIPDDFVGVGRPIQHDFEDGTTQGWGPFGGPPLTVANSTEAAFTGTHSLKTTNRTATFNGPSLNLIPPPPPPPHKLTPGANHRVSVAVRLAAGEAPTTVRVTVMRTPTGGSAAFDTVVGNTNVTADSLGDAGR